MLTYLIAAINVYTSSPTSEILVPAPTGSNSPRGGASSPVYC